MKAARGASLAADLTCGIAGPSRHRGDGLCPNHAWPLYAASAAGLAMAETKPILSAGDIAEATQVRSALALLISVSCAGCADFQKLVAQASAPQPAAAPASLPSTSPAPPNPAPPNPAPVADVAPARFECSDGTISSSQDACQIAMAKARLPPSSGSTAAAR